MKTLTAGLACLAAGFADAYTTCLCLAAAGHTGVEVNPFARVLIDLFGPWEGQVLQKTLAVVLCLGVGRLLICRGAGTRAVVFYTLAVTQAVAAGWNTYRLYLT